MKLFPVRGGVHPEYRKDRTSEAAIVALPLPTALYLPLQQHIGAPAEPVVAVGDRVLKGQVLAHAGGAVSAPTHAPTSGVIEAITDVAAPHPSGLAQKTIVLLADGNEEWADLPAAIANPFAAEPEALRRRVAESGIVGLGGATFPSAVKLGLGTQKKIHTLLLNGAECEPYLTCDDRVMREYAAEVVDGARIISWHIPVAVIATLFVFGTVFNAADPARYAPGLFHVLSGATMLGAFFIATDYVTSPVSKQGQLVFGFGVGALTWAIRTYAGYPEGMAFAVLLMNALTPIIDQQFRPRMFGRTRKGEPLPLKGEQ